MIKKADSLNDLARKYLSGIESLKQEAVEDFDVNTLLDDLYKLSDYQNKLNQYSTTIESNYNTYSDEFDKYYNGTSTDWKKIIDRLQDIKVLLNSLISVDFFKKVIISEEYIDKLLEDISNLLIVYNDIEWSCSLFKSKHNLMQINLKNLSEKFDKCLENLDSFSTWVDYRDNKKVCIDLGLEKFVQDSEDNYYRNGTLCDIFLKAFWFKWIKHVSDKYDSVSGFKAWKQNSSVSNFCKLDKNQFKLAQDRIRMNFIKSLPDYSSLTDINSQVGILKHEMNKKKRHKAIRQLFKEIPDLLLELKPCLMMSPLSVSTFLEDNTYRFDMVIFDEASQIFPQDAIGSIFRAKQVIIAGDSKQMPPTKYFVGNSNVGNDEDDEDELEESILEVASFSLPNHSLLWHYRSRNEALISFSNQEIYDNKLITFPGNVTKKCDSGVEYVYVEDGVYEKRSNKKEAEKCAELVKKHFDKYPKRSLGIIALNESQQSAIEDAINKFRNNNPKYESFFSENKEEPFFIKNLENVQGDERDTIIFSICFTKDCDLRSLGALNTSGGERRLNVAITRAKENIKVVGSILETDSIFNRAKSEGAKILKNYIAFARHGSSVFLNRQNVSENNATDSICESIARVIEKSGYEVEHNVGNSQYKIDIAIKNPYDKNSYIVGIECDGKSYCNAKTVRDRDRLRKEVLERMGWKMFRVWSTEWVNNYESEKKRLLDFVKAEIDKLPNIVTKPISQKTVSTASMKVSNKKNNQSVPTSRPYVPQAPLPETPKPKVKSTKPSNNSDFAVTKSADNKYGFSYYKKADITPKMPFNDIDIETWIYKIIDIEQPVHIDIIRERIAEIIGDTPYSADVRRYVDMGLEKNKDLIRADMKESMFYRTWTSNKVKVKIPGNDYGYRRIEYISGKEIAVAVHTIVSCNRKILVKRLVEEVCRLFKLSIDNQEVKKKVTKVVKQLNKSNYIKIVDQYVYPA